MKPGTQIGLFSGQLHTRENNAESQAHFNENKKRFHKQAEYLLGLYKKGVRLTRLSAATIYKIHSLERRHKDLKDAGENVMTEWVKDENGKRLYKEYFGG